MSVSTTLTKEFTSTFTRRGAYAVVLGTVLGTSVWTSFIAGPIMYNHLPRQMFGNLQSRLFPAYFALQSAGSLAMLTLWAGAYKAPVIKTQGSTANLYLIAGMAVAAVGNLVAVGPWTTGIMKRRHRLERLEGTTYDATDVERSPKMKELNTAFAYAHSVSSLLNLGLVIAGAAHTMWLAQYGSAL